jgi:rubrerythrin
MDDLRKRIEGCIEVERMAAEFYRTLAKKFPDDGDFWKELAVEEETHEAILIMVRGSSSTEKLPDEIVPGSLTSVKENIAIAKRISKKLTPGVSLKDACNLALDMETLSVEAYIQESIGSEWGTPIVAKFKELLDEEETHKEKIAKYMKQRGL